MKRLLASALLVYGLSSQPLGATDLSDASRKTGMNSPPVEQFSWGKTPGYIAMPVLIVDPTIGNGLALVGMLTTPAKVEGGQQRTNSYTVGASYTDTDSWVIGGQAKNYFSSDRFRSNIVLLQGNFNLDYYGSEPSSPLADNPVEYRIRGTYFKPRLLWRILDSSFFIGPQFSASRLKTRFDELKESVPEEDLDDKTYSIGLVLQYDSRDNTFSARQGSFSELSYDAYDRARHDGLSYEKVHADYNIYFPLTNNIVAGFQVQGDFARGDIPFYTLPYIDLRGFPAGRYTGENVVSLQGELRWSVSQRFGVVAFVGAGRAADEISSLDDSNTIESYGVGVRYMASTEDRINLGVDIATGPDDSAIYFRIGEAF